MGRDGQSEGSGHCMRSPCGENDSAAVWLDQPHHSKRRRQLAGARHRSGSMNGDHWRDHTHHDLPLRKAGYVRHAPSDVPAAARLLDPTASLVRSDQPAIKGALGHRLPLQCRDGDGIQRTRQRTDIHVQGSRHLFRHQGSGDVSAGAPGRRGSRAVYPGRMDRPCRLPASACRRCRRQPCELDQELCRRRSGPAVDVLPRMLGMFRSEFSYRGREAEGTQPPSETLRTRSGTCRDFAWLMIETLRRLGFASRFVSGYLYDAALDGGAVGMTGSGATHAWVQVFLPGAGWLDYDPTNSLSAGFDLIPVAIARHPGQAVPLAGSWFGDPGDCLGMSINVAVNKIGEMLDPSEG